MKRVAAEEFVKAEDREWRRAAYVGYHTYLFAQHSEERCSFAEWCNRLGFQDMDPERTAEEKRERTERDVSRLKQNMHTCMAAFGLDHLPGFTALNMKEGETPRA